MVGKWGVGVWIQRRILGDFSRWVEETKPTPVIQKVGRNQVTSRPLIPRPTHHSLTLESDPCFLRRTTLDHNPFLLGQGRILKE